MRLADLLALYLVAGGACGLAIWIRAQRPRGARVALSAAVAVPLWPVWAPVALSAAAPARARRSRDSGETARRIEAALAEGVAAAAGTPMSAMLSEEAAARIVDEVHRACARSRELAELLGRPELDRDRARDRLARLAELPDARPRALHAARLQLANVERLHAMREADEVAVRELHDLVAALRTQLVMARYAGSSAEGVGGIVSEVWARVEGLGEAMAPTSEAGLFAPDDD